MQLNINDDDFYESPSAIDVENAIRSLHRDTFAILIRGDEDYIQTYFAEDGSCELEYRAGSQDNHFRATDESLTCDDWYSPEKVDSESVLVIG